MKKIYTSILGLAIVAGLSSSAKAQITIDGSFTDWDAIAYTSPDGTGNLTGLKTYADATYVYFYIEGNSSFAMERYDIFINSDNNSSTGFAQPSYTTSGADILVQGNNTSGTIFNHTGVGTGFSFTPSTATFANTFNFSALTTVGTKKVVEFSLKKSELGLTTGTITFSYSDSNGAYTDLGDLPTPGFGKSYADVPLNPAPLPVSFLSFDGKLENNGVKLSWSTASEKDNAYFEVSKSTDGKSFNTIAKVNGSNKSDSQKFYSYSDRNVEAGITYYQLKQVDANGKSTTLKTISVNSDFDALSLKLKKAGAGEIELSISSPNAQNASFTLTDLSGRTIVSKNLSLVKGSQTVQISGGAKGLNIATLTAGGKVISQKVVID